jgi:2'-hydroxyisoflavone reductase
VRLLVIGGTRFAGYFLVDAALRSGHYVTLFNRGESDPEAFPDAERVHGDRDGGLEALRGRTFEAVVDMCGYFPRVVRQSAELLRETVSHYVFVSSISVYREDVAPGFDEGAPVITGVDPTVEEIRDDTYGGLKVLCEEEVERGFAGRAVIVRPGLIVGPRDRSDRLTYWVRRVAKGGEVLAPGTPDRRVQVIDARDLAEWMLRMTDARATGVFNATGPDRALTFGEILATSRDVSGSDARFEWVDEAFLAEQGVEPWTDLPVWYPSAEEAFDRCDVSKAIAAGLTFRPLAETVGDTLAWDRARPQDEPLKAGITRDRERELLDRWRSAGRSDG